MAREQYMKELRLIEDMTQCADVVQENVLAEILMQNANTEYLKGFEVHDLSTFKSKIPMINYEDIKPFIERIAEGDRSDILSGHPVTEFISSSGTSGGEPKLFPSNKEESHRRALFFSLLPPIINMHVKGLDKGKGLFFSFTRPGVKTKGGIVTQSALTSLLKTDLFKNRPYDPYNVRTSPNEAIHCVDTFQSMYTQILCGLYERQHINRIGATFASGLLRIIKFLELNWQQLAHDIKTGSLNMKVTDTLLRERMTREIMRPDPDLADFIARECAEDNWEGIITRIWPNTVYLDVVVSGTMSQYIPTLDYFSGGLPKASTLYASSECYFGINLDPLCDPSDISYTFMPNMAYFEFLPHEPDDDDSPELMTCQDLVRLVDVEIGKQYEVVVTTYIGLYRYRVGDILQVTGFHNSAPGFRFLRRDSVVLSIDTDKTNEVELLAAVTNASLLLKEFDASVVEYTSYADTTGIPGHYVMYWELLLAKDPTNWPPDEVLAQCCLAMEESLDWIYRRLRVLDNSIGPLEIRVVRGGTFEELLEYAISRGASVNQYKVPRCVGSKPVMDLLESRVVSTHFSPSLPKWTPERRL